MHIHDLSPFQGQAFDFSHKARARGVPAAAAVLAACRSSQRCRPPPPPPPPASLPRDTHTPTPLLHPPFLAQITKLAFGKEYPVRSC